MGQKRLGGVTYRINRTKGRGTRDFEAIILIIIILIIHEGGKLAKKGGGGINWQFIQFILLALTTVSL